MRRWSDRETKRQSDRVGDRNLTGRFLLLLLLCVGLALGQYSGTYTIMPSGGDFASHAEAADSLMTYGVVGPCTLLMYSGTYTGQAYFDNAPWDSVEVMFKAAPGESVAVEYSSYPWHIHYTDNITVDGIATSTSASYGYYIYYSHNTQVRNQTIAASSYGCYALRSPSTVFENCNISVGGYGLYFYYSDSCRVIGCRIRVGGHGLYMYYSGYRYVVGNNITSGGSYGIYAYRNAAGSYSYYDTIAVNMMNGTNYGIYHYYHLNSYVYGNTFYGGTHGYYSYYGYDEEFYNNIFLSDGTYPLYKAGGGPPAGCDYNCYWPDPRPAYHSGSGAVSLDGWRFYADLDSHSIYRDPLVGSPANLHLKAGSPCVDSGLAIAHFPLDIDGDTVRNGVRDIGADEYTGVGGPMSGPYLIHQDPDSGDYSNFADALDDLMLRGANGDVTFNVAEGAYDERVVVGDGAGGSYKLALQPRFYGTDSMEEVTIRGGDMTGSENLTLQGFNIISTGSNSGIRMYYSGSDGCDWCVIRDNCISAYYGIYMYYASHCSIIGNQFPASGYYGVYSYYADANVFINNMFSSTGYGMYMYQHDSTRLFYNSTRGGYYGFNDHYGRYEHMQNNILCGGYGAWYQYYVPITELVSDYNCFWSGDTLGRVINGMTLAEWQANYQKDTNSIQRDPKFVSETDLHLQAGSPCRRSALTMADIPYDIDGDLRDSSPDIGADEYAGQGAPMAGTYYIHPNPDSGDYVSFLEAWEDICARGFGGDIALRAYSGTYEGELDLDDVGNVVGSDTFNFTMEAVDGQTPVIQGSAVLTPAVTMTSAHNVTIRGLTISGYYGLGMYYTGSDSGCCNCSIVGSNINGVYGYGIHIYRGCNNVFAGNIIRSRWSHGLYWYGVSTSYTRNNKIYNNMVISTDSYRDGVYLYYHDSLTLVYNSICGQWGCAIQLAFSRNCRVMNNIVYNRANFRTIYYYGNEGLESDYNCLWNEDTVNPRRVFYPLTLQEWQDTTGLDSNSIAADPMVVSDTNLHLLAGSPCIDAGLAMAEVPYDIDGELRDSTPCIGADEVVGTGIAKSGRPLVVDLFRPAPNPASGPVRIRWQVPTLCRVSLKAYDISGRCIATLVDRTVETGVYVTVWHGRDNSGRRLAPGIYFYTLEAKDKKLTHKVVLTRAR
ncbi:MAG: right-handed parallel beta-helix repeat-containing protein [candidate division WOR-3 bacterium]|nr:MAG: right-handed parallel beta-helix repeat-containing protein [candidate division WOR-3 bacterium]